MRYTNFVAHNSESLEFICKRLSYYCQDNLINSIHELKYTEYELQIINNEVCGAILLLSANIQELNLYQEEFLTTYATHYNSCYNDAEVFFKKMKKSMNALAAVFKKFYPKMYRRRINKPITKEERSIHKWCRLTEANTQIRLDFDIPYPDIVYTLHENISELVHGVLKAITLCVTVQNKESEMKKDQENLLILYNNQFNEVAEALGFLSAGTFMLDKKKSHIPSHRLRQPEELASYYHVLIRNEFKVHVVCVIAAERDNQLATDEEINLWQSKENVLSVRFIAEHFDDILDELGLDVAKTQKHVTELIYYVVQRYGAATNLKKGVECFTRYFTESSSKSRFTLTKKGAVYRFYGKISNEEKAAVFQKYDEIIKPMLPKNGEIAI